MLFFIVLALCLVLSVFVICFKDITKDFKLFDSVIESKDFLRSNNTSKHKHKSLREEFLDNYNWACDMFGVRSNAYTENYDGWIKEHEGEKDYNRYFDYFICYRASKFTLQYYPSNIERCKSVIYNCSNGFETKGAEEFMKEFNKIVLHYRNSDVNIEELKELGISPAEYLKRTDKYTPETIELT